MAQLKLVTDAGKPTEIVWNQEPFKTQVLPKDVPRETSPSRRVGLMPLLPP
jgi:hypothetical protein